MWFDDNVNHKIEHYICKIYPDYAIGYYICRAITNPYARFIDQIEEWDMRSDFGWPTNEERW